LSIGTATYGFNANGFSTSTGTWFGDPSFEPMQSTSRAPFELGSPTSVLENFQIDINFINFDGTAQTIGLTSFLAASSFPDSTVEFGNTASLDSIILPKGYSIIAHGVPLIDSGNGVFLYAASVPESNTYAMLLAGLGVVGFVVRRKQI
jgi:hypothetical protein